MQWAGGNGDGFRAAGAERVDWRLEIVAGSWLRVWLSRGLFSHTWKDRASGSV